MYIKQMHKKHTVQSVFLGKDNFSVTVYPNVDYAFIASLVVILDDVNREDRAATGSSWWYVVRSLDTLQRGISS